MVEASGSNPDLSIFNLSSFSKVIFNQESCRLDIEMKDIFEIVTLAYAIGLTSALAPGHILVAAPIHL